MQIGLGRLLLFLAMLRAGAAKLWRWRLADGLCFLRFQKRKDQRKRILMYRWPHLEVKWSSWQCLGLKQSTRDTQEKQKAHREIKKIRADEIQVGEHTRNLRREVIGLFCCWAGPRIVCYYQLSAVPSSSSFQSPVSGSSDLYRSSGGATRRRNMPRCE